MAYATTNPPRLMMSAIGGQGPSWWSYDSADAASTVRAADYFSNALDLGMKAGDVVFQGDTVGATVSHIYPVLAVDEDGADLGDGTAIVVTNT